MKGGYKLEEFNVGKITVNLKFNKEKFLSDIEELTENFEILHFKLIDDSVCLYGEDEVYSLNIKDYIKIS